MGATGPRLPLTVAANVAFLRPLPVLLPSFRGDESAVDRDTRDGRNGEGWWDQRKKDFVREGETRRERAESDDCGQMDTLGGRRWTVQRVVNKEGREMYGAEIRGRVAAFEWNGSDEGRFAVYAPVNHGAGTCRLRWIEPGKCGHVQGFAFGLTERSSSDKEAVAWEDTFTKVFPQSFTFVLRGTKTLVVVSTDSTVWLLRGRRRGDDSDSKRDRNGASTKGRGGRKKAKRCQKGAEKEGEKDREGMNDRKKNKRHRRGAE